MMKNVLKRYKNLKCVKISEKYLYYLNFIFCNVSELE
jgi:hypothetical protein